MTTCREIEARLSRCLDGELSPEERADVETHLDGCAACRGVMRDLERVRRAAGALGPVAPPDHLWLEVAGQLRPAGLRRRVRQVVSDPRVAWRQWAALAAMLVVVTIGAYVVERTVGTPAPAGNAAAANSVEAVTDGVSKAMEDYDNAIRGLDEVLATQSDSTIGPAMAAALQKNITTIDGAIAESRTALSQNPASAPARESLFEALKSKVGVLQATVNLMNQMRRGDQAAAAEAAAAFGKKS